MVKTVIDNNFFLIAYKKSQILANVDKLVFDGE